MHDKNTVISYLMEHYPDENTDDICKALGLSKSALWTLATRNDIHKSKDFLAKQYVELMRRKEEKYLASIPDVKLNQLEQNIIVGSILGDGNITFAPRSRNAYYREHFSIKQKEYREWKMNSIHSLKFRIENECHLKSCSHPVFTELYNQFFINRRKTITEENIKLLDHPIGLACLYMDDGTLMISTSTSNRNIRVSPSVGITTLSFCKSECQILINHITRMFGINFYINPHPDGGGWNIKISKLKEINKFFSLIIPYCSEVACLKYKYDVSLRLEQKKQNLTEKLGNMYNVHISSIDNIPNYYSSQEIETICQMGKVNKTYQEIANALGRTYNGISYKLKQIKKGK